MKHAWVRITQQNVDAIEDPATGRFHAVDRPGEPTGEVVGCDGCGCPLTDPLAGASCTPIDIPLPSL